MNEVAFHWSTGCSDSSCRPSPSWPLSSKHEGKAAIDYAGRSGWEDSSLDDRLRLQHLACHCHRSKTLVKIELCMTYSIDISLQFLHRPMYFSRDSVSSELTSSLQDHRGMQLCYPQQHTCFHVFSVYPMYLHPISPDNSLTLSLVLHAHSRPYWFSEPGPPHLSLTSSWLYDGAKETSRSNEETSKDPIEMVIPNCRLAREVQGLQLQAQYLHLQIRTATPTSATSTKSTVFAVNIGQLQNFKNIDEWFLDGRQVEISTLLSGWWFESFSSGWTKLGSPRMIH